MQSGDSCHQLLPPPFSLSSIFLCAGISFTPKEVGEHEVSVRKNGVHVANSPFKIMVGQSEIGEASRVKAYGKGLVEAHTYEMAEFFVDTRNAGKTLSQNTVLLTLFGTYQVQLHNVEYLLKKMNQVKNYFSIENLCWI